MSYWWTVFSEHVLEHLSNGQLELALTNIYKYLKVGGNFRVAVSDGFFLCQDYLSRVAPPADGCLQLFNYKTLSALLVKPQFAVTLVEYWDEMRCFIINLCVSELDHIHWNRLHFHYRNDVNTIGYTSLLIKCD